MQKANISDRAPAGKPVENTTHERPAPGTAETPAFLDDIDPPADLPPHFTVTNTRELFDVRPGESLEDALARKQS